MWNSVTSKKRNKRSISHLTSMSLASCTFCSSSASESASHHLKTQQQKRPPITPISTGLDVQTRGSIQTRSATTISLIHDAIDPTNPITTCEKLFGYLWDLQANSNGDGAQDSFFINWNIENVWLKHETNTDPLPPHIRSLLPENDDSKILSIVIKHLSNPILLYISGPFVLDSNQIVRLKTLNQR
jgi:hypothetical protein